MSKKQCDPIWREKKEKWWYRFWKGVKEPWRPSKREVKFFEEIIKKLLKKKKEINLLVLGATPEFRDMLSKYKNVKVTLLDLNPGVKKAMDRLCKRKNKREEFIVGNWLEMNKIFPKNHFDVALNSGGFENIEINKHNLFFRNVAQVLKKDGYFLVDRACLEYCRKHFLSFSSLFWKYKKDPKFFQDFYNRLWYLYRLVFSPESKAYDHKQQTVKMTTLVKEIIERAKKEKIKNPNYLKWDPRVYYTFEYKEVDLENYKTLILIIQKYFKIEKIYQDLFHPVMKLKYNFVLRPKK